MTAYYMLGHGTDLGDPQMSWRQCRRGWVWNQTNVNSPPGFCHFSNCVTVTSYLTWFPLLWNRKWLLVHMTVICTWREGAVGCKLHEAKWAAQLQCSLAWRTSALGGTTDTCRSCTAWYLQGTAPEPRGYHTVGMLKPLYEWHSICL